MRKNEVIAMKKLTKKVTNLGTIDLSKIELMESVDMYIDISDLAEGLKKEVKKAVERGKRIYQEEREGYMKKRGQHWSNEGVYIFPQLHIVIPQDGKVKYDLSIYFQDFVDEDIADSIILEIDLSKHVSELKRAIFHVLVDKFI